MNIKLLSFSLCLFYIAANAQVAFEQNIVIDSTYGVINPRAIAVADIDNDGFKDLLIAGHNDAVWQKVWTEQEVLKM